MKRRTEKKRWNSGYRALQRKYRAWFKGLHLSHPARVGLVWDDSVTFRLPSGRRVVGGLIPDDLREALAEVENGEVIGLDDVLEGNFP